MIKTETITNQDNPKINESIFLVCDRCLWTATCLNKKYLEELSEISETEYTCPVCNQDQLSSFPIVPIDSFTYTHSKTRGIELTFGIRK
jgi:hypothetical protein